MEINPILNAIRTCPSEPSPFGGIFDYDHKHDRLVEVNRELEDASVWNKPEYAQSLGRERAMLAQIVETIDDLTGSLSDSRTCWKWPPKKTTKAR